MATVLGGDGGDGSLGSASDSGRFYTRFSVAERTVDKRLACGWHAVGMLHPVAIQGCQSPVWFHAEIVEILVNALFFRSSQHRIVAISQLVTYDTLALCESRGRTRCFRTHQSAGLSLDNRL